MSAAALRLVPPLQLVRQAAGGWRALGSGAAPPELPSLKAALREVYKRVHPDLFQDYQPARDANTRSFKLLHEYLEEAKTGPKVPLPYRFHFVLRDAASGGGGSGPAAGSGSGAAAAAAAAGFREVALTLPPPTRGAPGQAMSASTRKAFGSLLAALGLPARFGGAGGDEEPEADAEFDRFVRLRDFLPAAVEAVHQNAAAQASAAQQLGALRTVLRLGRRVTAGFGEPAASAGTLQQLPLLQRLVAALDALPPGVDLAGCTVMIGRANGTDALGTIWLEDEGSQEAWASYLSSVDVAGCRDRQQLRRAVRAQEAAVAEALGVAMLYTQQDASVGPQYRQALERLAAAAAQRGPVGAGALRDLPVMLQPWLAGEQAAGEAASSGSGSSSSSSSSKLGGCTLDSETGLLLAPMDVPPERLYAAVEKLGPQVLAAVRRRQQREKDLAALRTQVERKVMLRRLLRDPAVSDERYKSCMDRMLGHAQKLSGLLHGHSVRVAEINGLSPDKAVIDLAWNWQI